MVEKVPLVGLLPNCRGHSEPVTYRPQILIRDRLDDISTLIEHLNIASAIARPLLSVIERVLACILAAPDRANAFSFENFPAALFLPPRVA